MSFPSHSLLWTKLALLALHHHLDFDLFLSNILKPLSRERSSLHLLETHVDLEIDNYRVMARARLTSLFNQTTVFQTSPTVPRETPDVKLMKTMAC